MSDESVMMDIAGVVSESSTETAPETSNLAVAFGLVILAGGATAIGSSVVFFPSLVSLANSNMLAASLGFSAGVMIFVSFTEIFGKSHRAFLVAGFEDDEAFSLAIGTFFAGAVLMLATHYAMEYLLGGHGHGHGTIMAPEQGKGEAKESSRTEKTARVNRADTVESSYSDSGDEENKMVDPIDESDWGNMVLPCCDDEEDPRDKLQSYHVMAKEMKEFEEKKKNKKACLEAGVPQDALDSLEVFQELSAEDKKKQENDKITKMSYKTAFAIALHNFPEGLATFVAALEDPKMGLVLAIAIAIHNIPEGLAVSLPLYYATGNRRKAFLCGALSGFTEFLAAFLGWVVLASVFSPVLYGTVYGIVAGMMVLISVRELLPTAHQYDPQDKYVTLCFCAGMAVMALSLIMITLL